MSCQGTVAFRKFTKELIVYRILDQIKMREMRAKETKYLPII